MSSTVQTDPAHRLNTLDALVQLANLRHLPAPTGIKMQPGILSLTFNSHADAIAWCDEFGCGWGLNPLSGEVWHLRASVWRGWSIQIHSLTEKS